MSSLTSRLFRCAATPTAPVEPAVPAVGLTPAMPAARHPTSPLDLVAQAMARLVEQAAATPPRPDRLRAMEAALRDLREGMAGLNIQLVQARSAGDVAAIADWLPTVAQAMAEAEQVLPRLKQELTARRSRLGALVAVTRQRAQVEQGYKPMRGHRVAMVERQVRHCVHLVV